MKTNKGSAVLSALLYAQVLFGIAAITAVLLRMPAEAPGIDPMAVASVSGSATTANR